MPTVLLSEACHVGMIPAIKPDVPELTRGRLVQVDQSYFRAENTSAGNARYIEAHSKIDASSPREDHGATFALSCEARSLE